MTSIKRNESSEDDEEENGDTFADPDAAPASYTGTGSRSASLEDKKTAASTVANSETAKLAANISFTGDYASKSLRNPESITTNGAFGTIYKAEYKY
jgi:hypothetical protein